MNKLAAAISDTLLLGLLNEAIGGGIPVVLAVYTNEMLASHPAFGRSIETLRSYGVRFVPDTTDLAVLATKPAGVPFPWDGLRGVVAELYASWPVRIRPSGRSPPGPQAPGRPRRQARSCGARPPSRPAKRAHMLHMALKPAQFPPPEAAP